jgi:polyisoprenoid-binding protein YceI
LAGAEIDPQLSRVYIRVGKTGLGHPHGVEGRLASGHLFLGATQNAGDLVFDMRTFIADTPAARARVGLEGDTDAATQKKVNANMRGPDVLDVESFPQARFRITSATPRRATQPGEPPVYDLVGQFTLQGVTRPLRFEAVVTSEKGRSGVAGRFSIKQTDFGITPYTAALGAVGVADTLEIWGDLWFAPVRQVRR